MKEDTSSDNITEEEIAAYIENMTGTGNWQDGERFRSGASDSDVTSWVDGLGL